MALRRGRDKQTEDGLKDTPGTYVRGTDEIEKVCCSVRGRIPRKETNKGEKAVCAIRTSSALGSVAIWDAAGFGKEDTATASVWARSVAAYVYHRSCAVVKPINGLFESSLSHMYMVRTVSTVGCVTSTPCEKGDSCGPGLTSDYGLIASTTRSCISNDTEAMNEPRTFRVQESEIEDS